MIKKKQRSGVLKPLRRGWTTGACATAATKAALIGLLTGEFPDPVSIVLPKGETPKFPLSLKKNSPNFTQAGIIKDAGDDPDVTHGAMIIAMVEFGEKNTGIIFKAGRGVGTVTKTGLPISPGQAAINPVPRKLMSDMVMQICSDHNISHDITITISVPEGEKIARHTWNPRLGIIGGISILGTTGVVHPFSCSAWIHSIHRGIDVCRANGINHAIASTGSTSEKAAQQLYNLPEYAFIDMGDFAGAVLKYLRKYPVKKLTLAAGLAKCTKLACGAMDLHSKRSQVDMKWISQQFYELGGSKKICNQIIFANTILDVFQLIQKNSNIDIADHIAAKARDVALSVLGNSNIDLEIIIVSRNGEILARRNQ